MKLSKILALVSFIFGLLLIGVVVFPFLSYSLSSLRFQKLVTPIPENYDSELYLTNKDLTKASNWFVGGARSEDFSQVPKISYYTISIPKLGIESATVAIGGEDLSKSLIQYPGTALPGKRGNSVIFGHSILPQFYNPKNYLAIFSTLPSLKIGDEITVNYDGIQYTYKVSDMFEVLPTDIQVLEQNLSDSFVTLVTCVPPGHPLRPKRLIVRAKIDVDKYSGNIVGNRESL